MKSIHFKNNWSLTAWACSLGFLSYLFFYPFRRAYAATVFENIFYFNLPLKTLIIIAQVLGFAVSKWLGVKIISEILPQNKFKSLVYFALFSAICMLLFGLVPAPYSLFFIFLGSLPLGMFYGIILTYLEGRQISEFLVATLTASFIIGSGFAKTLGKWLIDYWLVPEKYVPFAADCVMFLPLVLVLWLLNYTPAPTPLDIERRTKRPNMNKTQRAAFLSKYKIEVILFIISYCILTAFREFRDNFLPEILANLKIKEGPAIFTKTEWPIAIAVITTMIGFKWVKDNKTAFLGINYLMILGGVLIGLSTFLFQKNIISPIYWLICLGFGVYLAYALCNSLYFERMIATIKEPSSVGFLITLADFYAYFGTIGILLYKHFFGANFNYVSFFINMAYIVAVVYSSLVLFNLWYFKQKSLN